MTTLDTLRLALSVLHPGVIGLIAEEHGEGAHLEAALAAVMLRDAIKRESAPDPLSQALNEGDGAYRP